MSPRRSALFTLVVLLFPCIQFLDWARMSSAVNILVDTVGLRPTRITKGTPVEEPVDVVVTRLRQDEPVVDYEARFAPVRRHLPFDRPVGYVVELGGQPVECGRSSTCNTSSRRSS